MVFSLFRKSGKSHLRDEDPDADSSSNPRTRTSGSRAAAGDAAREAARLTAEKIDQIESEMISDEDDIPLAPGNPAPATEESGDDVEQALARLRASTDAARKEREKNGFNTLVETIEATQVAAPTESMPADAFDADSLVATAGAATLPDLPMDALQPESRLDDSLDQYFAAAAELAEPGDALAGETEGQAMPADLEEAAILFSNGETEVALSVLTESLERNEDPAFRRMTWFMLFDLHRVRGDRESFDTLAIAYASDTESSPPAWNNKLVPPKKKGGKPNASPSNAVLGETMADDARKTVDQLIRAAGHKRECSLDCAALQTITAEAAEQLARLFVEFSTIDHPLKVYQIDNIFNAATAQTETGRPDDTEAFWKLALTCLQVKNLRTEFDDLSIDYCVTFEVSPPPWEELPGQFILQDDATMVDMATTVVEEEEAEPTDRLILRGELTGKIDEQRQSIRTVAEGRKIIPIDCSRLRRVDFVAAGELLNEQTALQSDSKVLRFESPSYLIYALMRVMGIHEMAQIKPGGY